VNIDQIVEALSAICPPNKLDLRTAPLDESFVHVPSACLRQAVHILLEHCGLYHLSTITGQDIEGQIELLYHFWDGHGLTLRTSLPPEHAHIETLVDLIPGAAFYEREVSEMLHVTFDGHPDPQPLLLPDDWNGGPPLRRGSLPASDEEERP
jgi:NADH-quinone oxidoreductase subunit C